MKFGHLFSNVIECHNKKCWKLDDNYQCVPRSECFSTSCDSSAITGTINTYLFGFEEKTLFIKDVETEECKLEVGNNGVFSFNIPFGACDMVISQMSTDTETYITFASAITSRKPVSTMVRCH